MVVAKAIVRGIGENIKDILYHLVIRYFIQKLYLQFIELI